MALANFTLPATMRAVMFNGQWNVSVETVPVPQILTPTDAIVKTTMAGICGSDLFSYRGFSSPQDPYVLGHEGIGIVVQLGSAVSAVSVGDYVVIPDNVQHGQLQMTPTFPTAYGGGVNSGDISGLQAEYARVPAADSNLIRLPIPHNESTPELEQGFLTTGDILSTGWTAVTWSGFEPGNSVVVFGAGPVGLLAAYSAIHRGASRVYSVDHVAARLDKAKSIGAIPINFVESDPVQQILALEPSGVDRAVDCVGMEALNSNLQFDQGIVVQNMIAVTGFQGGLGQVGVHSYAPGAPVFAEHPQLGTNISFPITNFWTKALSYQAGIVQPQKIATKLVELVAHEKLNTTFITSAIINIEQAPEYYGKFNRTEETKVFISFS